MAFLADHMWQSLQVFGCLAIFAFLTRRNTARFRQLLWRVAAVKLLIPFYLLQGIGGWFSFPVNHSAEALPAGLVRLIEQVSPWFAPSRQLHGVALWLLLGVEVVAVVGAAYWIRRALRAEAPRVADEAARLEKDPDDQPRGVGFFNAALMTAWTVLVLAGPLVSGAVADRLQRQALLRENEQLLTDAAVVIRPAAQGMGSRMRVTADASGVTIRNATLQEIGSVAYGVSRYSVYGVHMFQEGEVDWLTGVRYDVRISGRVIQPDDFDTYALRGPVTRKLALDYGLEIYDGRKCQPPCGRWGSFVLPASALQALEGVPPPPPEPTAADAKPPTTRKRFDDYLQAFNTGDRLTVTKFHENQLTTLAQRVMSVDEELALQKRTGGFTVVAFKERPRIASGWVRGIDTDALMAFNFETEPMPPFRVSLRRFVWVSPPEEYFPPRLPEHRAIHAIRTELERRARLGKFSGVVLVTRDGKVLLRQALGLADRDAGTPNNMDTRFRVASMTQLFTAVAALRLVQEGKVSLGDDIGRWVPEIKGRPIAAATIQQLLTHTSGTGGLPMAKHAQHRQELRTHSDYVRLFADEEPRLAPGVRHAPSDLGYLLLGRMIETASGKSWHDYVRDVVFEPAGMSRTGTAPETEQVEGRSQIYEKPLGTHAYVPAQYALDYRANAATNAYSTADDLAKFVRALRSNRLLDRQHTALLLEPHQKIWEGYSYGFGMMFYTGEWTGNWIGHAGNDTGIDAELWFSPDTHYQVIVLSNIDPPAAHNVSDFITARLPLR